MLSEHTSSFCKHPHTEACINDGYGWAVVDLNYSAKENKDTGGGSGRRTGLMAAHGEVWEGSERPRDTETKKRIMGKKRHSGIW